MKTITLRPYLSFWGIFLTIYLPKIVSSESKVTIEMGMTADSYVSIVCQARGPNAAANGILLDCPITKSRLCYMNCAAPAKLPMIRGCNYTEINSNHVMVTYTLDNRKVHKTGKWGCLFRDKKSRFLSIEAVAKPPPTTTTSTTTTTTTTTVAPPVVVDDGDVLSRTRVPPRIDNWWRPTAQPPYYPSPKETNPNDRNLDVSHQKFQRWLTMPELVFVLLGILGFSLVVNVIFCIRCALIKTYIDNLRAGEPEQGCLENCLCLPNDPYRRLKKRRFYLPPGGMQSLRGEQIYEDLHGGGGGGSSLGGGDSANLVMSQTPRPSQQMEIDPATGMMMIPVSKVSMNGGTFPRQHGGYVMARNNYVVMKPITTTSEGGGSPGRPRSSSQVLLYDDVPVDMRSTNSTSAIYAYNQKLRRGPGSGPPMMDDPQQHHFLMNDVAPPPPPPPPQLQSTVVPGQHCALMEEEEEAGHLPLNTSGSHGSIEDRRIAPLATASSSVPSITEAESEVETSASTINIRGDSVPATDPGTNPPLQMGGRATPPLPPYPPGTPEEQESATYTVDLIQHCSKSQSVPQQNIMSNGTNSPSQQQLEDSRALLKEADRLLRNADALTNRRQ